MFFGWQLSIEPNDSYMLGEETAKATTPERKKYLDWYFLKDGQVHPALCPQCGRRTDDSFIDHKFILRKKRFDISWTYDGYLILSLKARTFLERTFHGLAFKSLPSPSGFFVLDLESLPKLIINREKSGIRFEDYCDVCNHYAVTLLGLIPGTPPIDIPLAFEGIKSAPLPTMIMS